MIESLDPFRLPLEGTRLIEASAGTGKTHTITTLYLRLLLERELEVPEILVVTYTKAATAELRDRVRSRIRELLHLVEAYAESAPDPDAIAEGDDLERLGLDRMARGTLAADRARLSRALAAFDEAAIFTIHGFAQRILHENAFESQVGFDIEFMTDQSRLLADLATDFWTSRLISAPPEVVAYGANGFKRAGKPFAPELLARLAARVTAEPDTDVLPGPEIVEIDAQLVSWRAALSEVRRLWSDARDEILAVLHRSAGDLHVRHYAPEKVQGKYAEQLDVLLRSSVPGIDHKHFTGFKWFTRNRLRGSTKQKGKGKDRVKAPAPEHPFFDACQALMDADDSLTDSLDRSFVQLERAFVDHARRELARIKEQQHAQSFDDLLQRLASALSGPGAEMLAERIRTGFRAALIDEFQDTDRLQYHIFRRVWHAGGLPLFLIGDPKKAIYAFRGADVFAYMEARRDAGDRVSTLAVNWRSDPRVVRAVNALFSQTPQPFLFDDIPFEPVEPRPDAEDRLAGARPGGLRLLFVGEGEEGEARTAKWAGQVVPDAIADDIARLLGSGARIDGEPLAAGDVAVLCATNAQAAEMQARLLERGIMAVVQGDASVFETVDAVELERVLRAVADPSDLRASRSALCTTLLGESGHRLAELREPDADWNDWQMRFRAWQRVWAAEGSVAFVQRLFAEHGVQRRLLERADGERRLTNLLHLAELLQGVHQRQGGGPAALVAWLARMRVDEAARDELVSEAAQLRLESDAMAVHLVTIHKSKGLEYPIVYCPHLWRGRLLMGLDEAWVGYHEEDGARRPMLDIGSPDQPLHLAIAEQEALAEKLRLLYVALPRARHQVVVVWGAFAGAETSALAYLLHARLDPTPPAAVLVDTLRDRIDMAAGEAIFADLEALAAGTRDDVVVEPLPQPQFIRGPTIAKRARPLESRTFSRRLERGLDTSSFSALTRSAEGGAHHAAAATTGDAPMMVGRDVDAEPDRVVFAGGFADEGDVPVLLRDFPAGAGPGTMIHEVFEHLDFLEAQADADHVEAEVRRSLRQHGIPELWSPVLGQAVREALATPLGGELGPFHLAQLARADRVDELEFIFPVAHGAERSPLSAERLARCFERHASDPRTVAYADRLAELEFAPLRGFLRGYVDLLFRVGDRYFVVDYKSNRLGERVADYGPSCVDAAMAEHHYILQYHLYLVAAHRHLRARLPGYDYDRNVGGSYYLFLRGMAPGNPAQSGIHHDRPPRALVEALSDLMEGSA